MLMGLTLICFFWSWNEVIYDDYNLINIDIEWYRHRSRSVYNSDLNFYHGNGRWSPLWVSLKVPGNQETHWICDHWQNWRRQFVCMSWNMAQATMMLGDLFNRACLFVVLLISLSLLFSHLSLNKQHELLLPLLFAASIHVRSYE